jgi:hypothetical protein
MAHYLKFDGTNDYVEIESPGNTSSCTIIVEAIWDVKSWQSPLVGANIGGATADGSFALGLSAGGNPYLHCGGGDYGSSYSVEGNYPIEAGVLYEFEAVFSGLSTSANQKQGTAKLYVNDVYQGEFSPNSRPFRDSATGIAKLGTNHGWFNGKIKRASIVSDSKNMLFDPTTSGGTGNTLTDSGTSATTATLVNFTTSDSKWVYYYAPWNDITIPNDYGLALSGASQYMVMQAAPALQNYTWEFDVNIKALGTNMPLVGIKAYNATEFAAYINTAGKLAVYINTNGANTLQSTGNLSLGINTIKLKMVFAATTKATITLNGTTESTKTSLSRLNSDYWYSVENMWLARSATYSASPNLLIASCEFYNDSKSLHKFYDFNRTQGTEAPELINGQNGTLVGFGGDSGYVIENNEIVGYRFDGVGDYALAPFTWAQNLTIEIKFKSKNALDADGRIFSLSGTGTRPLITIGSGTTNNTNKIRLYFSNNSNVDAIVHLSGNEHVPFGEDIWRTIKLTLDGTNVQLYYEGALIYTDVYDWTQYTITQMSLGVVFRTSPVAFHEMDFAYVSITGDYNAYYDGTTGDVDSIPDTVGGNHATIVNAATSGWMPIVDTQAFTRQDYSNPVDLNTSESNSNYLVKYIQGDPTSYAFVPEGYRFKYNEYMTGIAKTSHAGGMRFKCRVFIPSGVNDCCLLGARHLLDYMHWAFMVHGTKAQVRLYGGQQFPEWINYIVDSDNDLVLDDWNDLEFYFRGGSTCKTEIVVNGTSTGQESMHVNFGGASTDYAINSGYWGQAPTWEIGRATRQDGAQTIHRMKAGVVFESASVLDGATIDSAWDFTTDSLLDTVGTGNLTSVGGYSNAAKTLTGFSNGLIYQDGSVDRDLVLTTTGTAQFKNMKMLDVDATGATGDVLIIDSEAQNVTG